MVVVVVKLTRAFITRLLVWNLKTCSEMPHSCVFAALETYKSDSSVCVSLSRLLDKTALRQEARLSRTCRATPECQGSGANAAQCPAKASTLKPLLDTQGTLLSVN